MNTNLDTAVQKLINKALEGVETSVSFLQSEIPDYIHQLILWYSIKNIVWGAFTVVIILLWAKYLIIKPINMMKNGEINMDFSYLLPINMVILVPIIFAIDYLSTAVQIYIAPKVWLLEYASSLVK